ncbi:hypothetical protein EJ08DRAFT_583263 [Tothia fuscella]|uniref:Bromo domain-containing protein n=1 Tax=Tothia fuscella TaxID=1048955 RepID=A0A9P4NY56_9PEZI|nr:hypothetical protein EJ08DRAFT_583263 [Tothia fuscella]
MNGYHISHSSSRNFPHGARPSSAHPFNPGRLRTPNITDSDMGGAATGNNGGVSAEGVAQDDARVLQFREHYLQSERRLAALFADKDALSDDPKADSHQTSGNSTQNATAPSSAPPKKPARTIDEDDYGDEDDEDGAEPGQTSPLQQKSALAASGRGFASPAAPLSPFNHKPPLHRLSSIDQAKHSDDVRRQAEESKEALEEAAKRSFHTLFYTLENDRVAMLEQQRIDELDRQVEAETSGQEPNGTGNAAVVAAPQQGSLSTANLGASSLMLKHLLARVDGQRHKVHANDTQLRRLISEVRKNRSKWASEDKVNQEELYEAAEKVLQELKAMTENSLPFLNKVSKREAPDYYNFIKNPMDIGSMMKKLKGFQYKSKKDFVDDLHLIWTNCLKYNTDPQHPLRKKALVMQKHTDRLVILIPDLVVRDRAEVEAEERRNASLDADLDGIEDSEDEEPIMASRGRKAPSKTGKKGNATTARKGPNTISEDTPVPDVKPQVLNMASNNSLRNNYLRADSDAPMENGFSTPPPGTLTPLMNGVIVNGAGGSQADASEGEGMGNINDLAVPTEEPELDDQVYQTWKQLTKKARASIAQDRNRMFRNDRINPEGPALLRSKAGMRRWMRQQKKNLPQEESSSDPATPETGKDAAQAVPGETLAEGMEEEDDTLLPDYYDPLSGIPEIPERLSWEEDANGNVVMHNEECLRMIPKGHFSMPQSILTQKMEANMRQMQETRKICAKIGVVKQMQLQAQMYSNQFQKYDPQPFIEVPAPPIVVSDDGPFMAPYVCRATLQRAVGKIFYHAGYEETQPAALEAVTDVAIQFFHGLVQSLNLYNESCKVKTPADGLVKGEPAYQRRFSYEETILHTLDENGVELDALESYVKDDVDRLGGKLGVMHERMRSHLADLLRPALDPNQTGPDGVGFNDQSEQFVGGDFAEDIGEDYFGFKELGLMEEFGLSSLSVPLHLLQNRMYNAHQSQNISAIAVSGTIMEPSAPFEPVTIENIGNEIGIVQQFFLNKLSVNNENPLIEDEDLPVKQRFPKPRLPPTGKITSPRKRPIREQQQMAKKKRKLEEGKEEVNGVIRQPGFVKPTGKLSLDVPTSKENVPDPEKGVDDDAPGMMSPESM